MPSQPTERDKAAQDLPKPVSLTGAATSSTGPSPLIERNWPNKSTRIRLKAICARWRTGVLHALLAATVFELVAPIFSHWLRQKLNRLGDWAFWPGLILPAVTLLMASLFKLPRNWNRLRRAWCYPSIWTSTWLAVLFLTALYTASPSALRALLPPYIRMEDLSNASDSLVWVLVLVGLGPLGLQMIVVGRHLLTAYPGQHARTGSPPTGGPFQLESLDSILEWLRSDDEIKAPDHDLFEHMTVARRIAKRLDGIVSRSVNSPPTMALVGELGSGKSTILELTKCQLREQYGTDGPLVVNVSLWQFETPQAALRGILDAVIDALGGHVSTVSLTGLSGRYVDAVEKLGGFWAAANAVLKSSSRPEQILASIDDVALAADIHVVLWIEDLERFAGAARGVDGRNTKQKAAARLNAIQAMLFHLQRTKHLSVVVATTSLTTQIDLQKISRYVEEVPPLKPQSVWRLLHRFRKSWRDQLQNEGYLDSVEKRDPDWDDPDLPDPHSHELIRYQIGERGSPVSLPWAICFLCQTPRQLKLALRHCHEVWASLKGEIDPDDVLAMAILRFAEPKIFALVRDNIPSLRTGIVQGHETPSLERFQLLLEDSQKDYQPKRKEAVQLVMDAVFPAWRGKADQDWRFERPQGLAILNEVQPDYWSRYMAAWPLSNEDRDQPVLRSIHSWQGGLDSDLPGRLATSKGYQRVRAFSWLLNDLALIRLLDEVAQDRNGVPQRISFVWGLMTVRNEGGIRDRTRLAATIEDLLVELLNGPTNQKLATASELVGWFAANSTDRVHLLSAEVAGKLLKAFYAALAALSVENLGLALDGGPPTDRLLSDLVHRPAQAASAGLEDERMRLRENLMAAAKVKPEIVLPRIAIACASESMTARDIAKRYSYSPEATAAVFVVDDLRALFMASAPSFPDLRTELQAAYECVRCALIDSTAADSDQPRDSTNTNT